MGILRAWLQVQCSGRVCDGAVNIPCSRSELSTSWGAQRTSSAFFLAAFLIRSASRSALYSSSLSPEALPSALVFSASAFASLMILWLSTLGSVLISLASSSNWSRT